MKASWRLFEQHEGETVEEAVFVGIDRMIGKAMNELDAKISSEIAKVVADERETKVLHSLRKHCKRLRYTIELLPATERRTDAVRVAPTVAGLPGGDPRQRHLDRPYRRVATPFRSHGGSPRGRERSCGIEGTGPSPSRTPGSSATRLFPCGGSEGELTKR